MDLMAYMIKQDKDVSTYIDKHYGEIPRCRGIRFMKLEVPIENDNKPNKDVTDLFPSDDMDMVEYDEVNEMFNRYVGQDVIYIHTRCGDCGMGYEDEDSNYVYCGAKDWEEEHKDLFLDHITDPFDSTYCTHFFKAVVDDEYNKIIQNFEEANKNNE